MSQRVDVETQPSLLLRMRDHDDDAAWRTFVEVYSPLLYGFCRSRGLQASDAADVTQEALLRVSRAIRTFDYSRQRGQFRSWLSTVVQNEIRRHMSKRKDVYNTDALAAVLDEQADSQWHEQFQQHMFETALKRCAKFFSEQTWEMFRQSWLQRIPVPAVAKNLDVSVDQIYVARSRVLKRLKHEISMLADDCV